MKNVLIIGFGSIGKRHLKILKLIEYNITIYTNQNVDGYKTFKSLDEAIQFGKPDYVIVANETSKHMEALNTLGKYKIKAILVEKPIFLDLNATLKTNNDNIFVGYNLRFHPLLRTLKKEIQNKKIISADATVGSYLPNWRKETNYKNSYSVSSKRGGGVLRDLSHEIDYLSFLFGKTKELVALGGHYSPLFGDSDDCYKLIMKMEKCSIVSLSLDYINRIGKREITINTESNTLHLDFIKNELVISGQSPLYLSNFNNDDTYRDQHLDIINNNGLNTCSFDEGISIVKILLTAERSNIKKQWINI